MLRLLGTTKGLYAQKNNKIKKQKAVIRDGKNTCPNVNNSYTAGLIFLPFGMDYFVVRC